MIDLNDSPAVSRGAAASTGSTLRRLAAGAIAAGLFSLGVVPAAFAQGIPFTDQDGNTCTTAETVAGPNGETLCPASVSGHGGPTKPDDRTLLTPLQRAVDKLYNIPTDPDPDKEGVGDEIFFGGGAPAHLGMYASPYGGIGGVQANGFSVSGSGAAITDSSGQFGGARTAGFTGSGGGGGIYGAIDPTPNLELGGRFDYQHVNLDFGGGGSERFDEYKFSGDLKYYWKDSYARVALSYSFGPANTVNAATPATAAPVTSPAPVVADARAAIAATGASGVTTATGGFNTNGLTGDVEAGHVFTLADTISGAASERTAKGLPPAPEGYDLRLDLSGHGGYDWASSNGFTDSTGFTSGTSRYQYGDIGAKAKLEALVPAPGILWMPYIEATLDQHLGTIDQLNVPEQAGVTVADLVKYSDANTFWGGRIGLSTRMRAGLSLGVNGFVSASSDLTIVGGEVFIKKQF